MDEPRKELLKRAETLYTDVVINKQVYYYGKTRVDTEDKVIQVISEYLTQNEINEIKKGVNNNG